MTGLIKYLLMSSEGDIGQRNTFFQAHLAFIPPINLLGLLVRQFDEASTRPEEECRGIQASVLRVIKCWLNNSNVTFTDDVLAEMTKFVITVDTHQELVQEVLRSIDGNASIRPLSMWPSSSSSTSKPTPHQLALVLAKLEWELYRRIRPSEFVAYAGGSLLSCPNLQAATSFARDICMWIQLRMLDLSQGGPMDGFAIRERSRLKEYFIVTAMECQKIRNFSSVGSIAGALLLPTIDSLSKTHKLMQTQRQEELKKLKKFTKSNSNYRTYRRALQDRPCIPWLQAHLDDIKDIMRNEESVDKQPEPPLLRFEKWTALQESARSALQYRGVPFNFEEASLSNAMDYLKGELLTVREGDLNGTILGNSRRLAQIENSPAEPIHRELAIWKSGFGPPPGSRG